MASEDYFQSTVVLLCEILPPKIHSLMELFRMSILGIARELASRYWWRNPKLSSTTAVSTANHFDAPNEPIQNSDDVAQAPKPESKESLTNSQLFFLSALTATWWGPVPSSSINVLPRCSPSSTHDSFPICHENNSGLTIATAALESCIGNTSPCPLFE